MLTVVSLILFALVGSIIYKSKFRRGMASFVSLAALCLVLTACADMEQSDSGNKDHQDETDSTQEKQEEPKQEQQQSQKEEKKDYVHTAQQGKKAQAKNQVAVKLSRVVDGDTIKVYYKGKEETVRYLLMDTPESKKPGECVQPYAEKASKRNEQLIQSGKLTLEFEKSRTDKYGRLLAYVFVDGKSVQETLIKEGLARVAYIYEPPYKYLSDYEQAQEYAKKKKLNVWSKKSYVSSRGFNGCAKDTGTSQQPTKQPVKQPATQPTPQTGKTEYFQNCTELRKKYPDGVPEGHPAYQSKMDRDKDGYACER